MPTPRRGRRGKDWRSRFSAVLEETRGDAEARELRRWLGYCDTYRRYAAARELGRRRDPESVRALLSAVFSYGDLAAVEALGQIGDQQCLAPLTTLFDFAGGLQHYLVDVLGRTIAGFGESGITALLPFANRYRGLLALSHAGLSPRVLEAVRAQLGTPLGWCAEDTLIEIGAMQRVPPVPHRRVSLVDVGPLASREDWQSRLLAVQMLSWWFDPQIAEPLLAMLREDPDVVVRYCARRA